MKSICFSDHVRGYPYDQKSKLFNSAMMHLPFEITRNDIMYLLTVKALAAGDRHSSECVTVISFRIALPGKYFDICGCTDVKF